MPAGAGAGTAWLAVKPDMRGFAKGVSSEAESSGGTAGGRFSEGFKSKLKIGAAIGGALAVAAGGKFLKESINEASNLGESVNAVNVTFGKAAGGILKLGENAANAVGLSNSEFNGLAVQFSAFADTIAGKGGNVTGVMKDLTTRGADFASVMNLEVNEAMGLFQSGLAGETEPLRKFGIDLSAAAVEAHAYAEGIAAAGKPLTENQKVQARYSLLMQQTAKTQGDFKNTSDSLANSQRILGANWDNMQAKVGAKLIPTLERLSGWALNTGLPMLSRLGGFVTEKVIPPLVSMAGFVEDNSTAFKVGAAVLGTMIAAMLVYKGTVLAVTKATAAWNLIQKVLNKTLKLNPIGVVVTALALLGTGLVVAYKKSETFRKIVDGAFQAVAKAGRWLWNNVMQPVFSNLVKGFGWVMQKFGAMLRVLGSVPGGAFDWADKAGRKMEEAGRAAIEMADDIKKIPDQKSVNIDADTSGANRAIAYTKNQLADLQRLADRGIRVAGVTGAGGFTARAIGGPVVAGRPYLVGEEGPELIVPRSAGHVMTAAQTRRAMQTARYGPAISTSQWRDMSNRGPVSGARHVTQNFPSVDASASTAVAARALAALDAVGV